MLVHCSDRIARDSRRGRARESWVVIGAILGLAVLWIYGCNLLSEDSWQHYIGGGEYSDSPPSASPDGATIVYSSPRSGHGDIYAVDIDGSDVRQLTTSERFEAQALHSPDGSLIVFAREKAGRRHLWIMEPTGQNQKQLTFGRVLDDVVSFRPDGKELYFLRSPLPTGLGRFVEPYAILLDDPEAKPRRLDAHPVWSPDGGTIAYASYNGTSQQYEIWLCDPNWENRRFLAQGHSPQWSPDGSTLLYRQQTNGPGDEAFTTKPDGTEKRSIGQLGAAVFLPDGTHIVAFSPEWSHELWRVDVGSSHKEALGALRGVSTGLRPCGKGGIFTLSQGEDRLGDIYYLNPDTWEVRRVTTIR
jgi:Tol biopolymer transport system component